MKKIPIWQLFSKVKAGPIYALYEYMFWPCQSILIKQKRSSRFEKP